MTGIRRIGRDHLLRLLLPLAAGGVVIFLWNYVPIWLGFDSYEVPNFSEDIGYIGGNWGGVIWPALQVTIVDALLGFLVGNLIATVAAIMFSQSKLIEWTFFPLAILVQTVPIVIVSPLLLNVFTVLRWGPEDALPFIGMGTKPVLCVTILISFFPTLVNMTVGLKAVDPNLYEFMQLVNSSKFRLRGGAFNILAEIVERWRILWKLRLPSAVPYLFSSFKITATLCFVGAVVAEYFLSNATGVGGLLILFNEANDKPGDWAATIAVSAASMLFFGIVVIAERVLVPWREER